MSRSQKIVFFALALILVLFVVVVGYGTTQPDCAGSAQECASKNPASKGMASLGSLFGSTGNHVTLPQPSYTLRPGAGVEIAVPAAKSLSVLKISLDKGDASHVAYADHDPTGLPHAANAAPSDQDGELPGDAASPDDPRVASFTITKAGGTLTVTCKGSVPCVIAQH